MTSKEKGDEFISKYLDLQIHGLSTIAASNRAVQCSIIAVEEIIKVAWWQSTVEMKEPYRHSQKEYWEEVLNYLKGKQ